MTSSRPTPFSLPRLSRREWLVAGGLALAGCALPRDPRAPERHAAATGGTAEVRLRSDTLGTAVGFDPVGIWVSPGTVVRWVVEANVHTVTAYHPRNGRHSLRIPKEAQPFDSGFLINPGATFEQRLTVEGVYDYFCLPHEAAGMVGRVVVGQPAGPGTWPFDYFKTLPEAADWLDVPQAARTAFPTIERIVREKTVPLPASEFAPHH